MPVLFVIGTLFAVVFLLMRRQKAPRAPKIQIRTPEGFLELPEAEAVSREAYLKEREAWLAEHTDPLFGRPVDDMFYWDKAKHSWDTKNVLNEYRVPFRYCADGFVTVMTDEFPLFDQKFIFEWMNEKMEEIAADVRLRLGVSSTDMATQAAKAFRPEQISDINFKGSEPVVWEIRFDADVDYGESVQGMIKGTDQNVESVTLLL